MKKIFTLLFAVGFLTAVNAQPGTRDTRDNQQYGQRDNQQNTQLDNNNGYSNGRDVAPNDGRFGNDDRYDNRNSIYGRGSMQMQIAQINRKYDFRVQQVRNDFFMRRYEKMRAINSLEFQRQQEIRMLYARSNNRGWQRDHDYDPNHRF